MHLDRTRPWRRTPIGVVAFALVLAAALLHPATATAQDVDIQAARTDGLIATQSNPDLAAAREAVLAGVEELAYNDSKRSEGIYIGDYGFSSYEEVYDFYIDLFYANPQCFYLTSTCQVRSVNGVPTQLFPEFYLSATQIPFAKARYESALAALLSWVPDNATTANKVKAVHDWLVRNCAYNREAASLGPYEYGYAPWTAYGALVNHAPVCEGYSFAFIAAMNELGIESSYVSGNGHGWNRVLIDGQWYNVDVTYDDPIVNGSDEGFYCMPSTDYFLKSDKYFAAQGHESAETWTNGAKAATSTKYDSYSSWPTYSGPQASGDGGASSDAHPTKATGVKRLQGQTALDTMAAIVSAGNYPTGGTVVLATLDGYWDALTAGGVAGLNNAPILMTSPSSLSPQTASILRSLKPKKIIVAGGTSALPDKVVVAAASAAGGATVDRRAGDTATGTANALFTRGKYDSTTTWGHTAFVCTNEGYWDALAAAPISYAQHMPIFLTEGKSSISRETLATMQVGGITSVYIVGGTSAISNEVRTTLNMSGIKVIDRLEGATAIETSEAVAKFGLTCGMTADSMGIATMNGYWDALSGAALCGRLDSVMVLVGNENSHSIGGFVKSNASQIAGLYVFGGKAAVSDAVVAKLKSTLS